MSTILITGASSGLGAEMARQFAALGHDLALCARRTDNLEALRAEIAASHPGVRVEVRALDVNDHDAVFRVFGEFRDLFESLDRVVVNAGLGKGQVIGHAPFAQCAGLGVRAEHEDGPGDGHRPEKPGGAPDRPPEPLPRPGPARYRGHGSARARLHHESPREN